MQLLARGLGSARMSAVNVLALMEHLAGDFTIITTCETGNSYWASFEMVQFHYCAGVAVRDAVELSGSYPGHPLVQALTGNDYFANLVVEFRDKLAAGVGAIA